MRTAGRPLAALLLCLALATPACTAPAAWERGRLAKPQMAPDPDPPQRALREHTYRSREAGANSSVGKGGGCGCY